MCPETFIPDNVIAPVSLLSVVIVTPLPINSYVPIMLGWFLYVCLCVPLLCVIVFFFKVTVCSAPVSLLSQAVGVDEFSSVHTCVMYLVNIFICFCYRWRLSDMSQMRLRKTWSGSAAAPIFGCLALTVCLTAASDILEYYILEELAPRRVVGDLVNDFGFSDLYDRATVESLRFSVLKQPAHDRRFFAVNETSGVIETTHRVDRELICRGDDECIIKFDVAVKPMRYFQIIKVRAVCKPLVPPINSTRILRACVWSVFV